jgi:TonB dependent receptor
MCFSKGACPAPHRAPGGPLPGATYYRLVSDRFTDEALPSFGDLQFKATLYPTKRTRLTVFGLAGREMLLDIDRMQLDAPPVVMATNRGDNRIAAATLRWMPSSQVSTATTLSAYSTSSRYVDRMQPTLSELGAFDRDIGVTDIALRHQLHYASSKGRVLDTGVDLHRVRSSWNMAGVKQPEWWRGIGPSTWGELVDYSAGPVGSRIERTQAGAWFQVQLDAGRLMTLEPGVRVDWNSLTGEAAWQPRLRVLRAWGKTSIWGGFSMQAQTPSHESLQGFDYIQLSEETSGTLRNQRTQQIVAGIERPIGGGFSLRVEAYRRAFDRLLVQRQETEAERRNRLREYDIPEDLPRDHVLLEHRPTVFPENSGTGQAAGVEVLLRRERRRVSGWIGYTLAKATRDLYGHTVPFDFDRRHAATAVVEVPLSSRFRAAATWQIASGFPVTPVREEVLFSRAVHQDGTREPLYRAFRNRDGNLASFIYIFHRRLSSINSERLTGYSRLDARVTYSTRGHWEFYGEVLNALNSRNYIQRIREIEDSGVPQVIGQSNVYNTFERMVSFGMRVKF